MSFKIFSSNLIGKLFMFADINLNKRKKNRMLLTRLFYTFCSSRHGI